MKNLFTLIIILFSMIPTFSQEISNETKDSLRAEISKITEEEKEVLRKKVEEINQQMEKGILSKEEGDKAKKEAAAKCAENIESRTEELEAKLDKSSDNETTQSDSDTDETNNVKIRKRKRVLDDEEWDTVEINWRPEKKVKRGEPITTSQFVFSFGLNNLISDGDLQSVNDNGIKVSNSRYYEWGWTWKTRFSPTSSFANLKYGLSLTYNNLRPEGNYVFEKNGNQTVLTKFEHPQRDEPYFRHINLVLPLHLEFDFSPSKTNSEGNKIIRSQRGFRLGVGGYGGVNTRTKQLVNFVREEVKVEEISRGNFNNSSLVYGLSGYLGYKDVSIYCRYDMNPLFTDNTINQHNASLGLRFDFH